MKFTDFSIKTKLLIVLVPLFLVISLVLVYLVGSYFKEEVKNNSWNKLSNAIELFQNISKNFEEDALLISKFFAQYPFVNTAYKTDDPEKSFSILKKNTDLLISKLTDNPNNFKIHFHKPPATSFYRSWTNKRNDDLSNFRKTILEVYRTKQPLKGIELGVGGFAIRGITPILDTNKNYLGSVEYFFTPKDVMKLLKTSDSKLGFFSMVDANLADQLFEKKELEKSFEKKELNYYISKASEEWIAADKILNLIKDSINSTSSYSILNLDNFSVGIFKINDYSGQNVGNIVFVQDNTEQEKLNQSRILVISLIIVSSFLILFIVLLYLLNKTVVNPLNTALSFVKKIENGDFNF